LERLCRPEFPRFCPPGGPGPRPQQASLRTHGDSSWGGSRHPPGNVRRRSRHPYLAPTWQAPAQGPFPAPALGAPVLPWPLHGPRHPGGRHGRPGEAAGSGAVLVSAAIGYPPSCRRQADTTQPPRLPGASWALPACATAAHSSCQTRRGGNNRARLPAAAHPGWHSRARCLRVPQLLLSQPCLPPTESQLLASPTNAGVIRLHCSPDSPMRRLRLHRRCRADAREQTRVQTGRHGAA
jgi:hypothetical protein